MSIVVVTINSYFYEDSEGHGKGWKISTVYNDEKSQLRITKERNGMYHLAGKYGDLGWVYPDAIIEFL